MIDQCEFPGCAKPATEATARNARAPRLCDDPRTTRFTAAKWVSCFEHRDWLGPDDSDDRMGACH